MNESNRVVNNGNRAVFPPIGADDEFPERLWEFEDVPPEEERPAADVAGVFVGLGYIRAAIRRGVRVWGSTALVGLFIGLALYVAFPPSAEATTSIYITNNPDVDAISAMQTNVALAESRSVAGPVAAGLGLKQTVGSLQSAYTATAVTNQILVINLTAPTSAEAVTRAKAVANSFLTFRANMLQTQQRLQATALSQQVSQAAAHVSSLNRQISLVQAEPASGARQAHLKSLRSQLTNANSALNTLQQTQQGNQASSASITAQMIQGTEVLDSAAPVTHSKIKKAAEYVGAALLAGLLFGIGGVAIRAMITDRLRRRDDIAEALEAPVRLSVTSMRAGRTLPSLPGRPSQAAVRERDIRRVAGHLSHALPAASGGRSALAVVAVDNADFVARCVVTLALAHAGKGKQVVVADLSDKAAAARTLGAKGSGVRTVNVNNVPLVVVVPEPGDVVPVGPVRHGSDHYEPADEMLTNTYAAADLLLVLTTLDPALGAEHLATWADDAVVVVTAGRSSATRIHATGEMIRLAGLRLDSAVLLGTDRTDPSLGVLKAPDSTVLASSDMGAADR